MCNVRKKINETRTEIRNKYHYLKIQFSVASLIKNWTVDSFVCTYKNIKNAITKNCVFLFCKLFASKYFLRTL